MTYLQKIVELQSNSVMVNDILFKIYLHISKLVLFYLKLKDTRKLISYVRIVGPSKVK